MQMENVIMSPVQWHSSLPSTYQGKSSLFCHHLFFLAPTFPNLLPDTSYWSHITLHSVPHNTLVCGCWCMFLPFHKTPLLILLPIFTIQGGDKILLYPTNHFLKTTTHLWSKIKGHFSHPFAQPFNYISLIRAFITLYCNWLFAYTLLLLYQLEEDRGCVYFFTTVSLNSHFTSMLIINCSVNVLIWFTLILVIPVGKWQISMYPNFKFSI